jgi:hypothetical protein
VKLMDWRRWVRLAAALPPAAAMAYAIWRVEWFDVFRWGMPSPDLLIVYACYVGVAGSAGWFLAAMLTPRRHSD